MKLQFSLPATLIPGLLIAVLLLPNAAWAAPQLKLALEFNNENWFPLEKQIMEDAVVDSAVSQFSEDVDFMLLSPENPDKNLAADLRIITTLIGPAQEVKVLMNTTMGDRTRQAEAVVPIKTQDYASIFKSFSVAGRSAARKLASQFDESLESSEVSSDDIEVQKLLNQAAQLKREKKFEQSYSALHLLVKSRELSGDLKESVEEELYYKLPLFQAQHLMAPQRQMQTPEAINTYYDFIESILQKALERNLGAPARQRTLNAQLDTVYQAREQYLKAIRYNDMSRLSMLRTSWHERYAVSGKLSREDLLSSAERLNVDLTVTDYESDDEGVRARLETGVGYEYKLTISRSPMNIELAPMWR